MENSAYATYRIPETGTRLFSASRVIYAATRVLLLVAVVCTLVWVFPVPTYSPDEEHSQTTLSIFMVGTRSQKSQQMATERARLEASSLEELRQEALRYQLPVTTLSNKELLIEVIMSHLEQNSTFEEVLPPAQRSRAPSVRSRKDSGQAELPGPSSMSAPAGEAPGSLERIAVTLGIFLEQQRRMLDEMRTFVRRDSPAPNETPRQKEREEAVRSPAISASSPAQAVSLLAPQIPEYGGTDEENVQIWTQRVNRVVQIHIASDDVVLLAASGILTKLAKQWYKMQNGNVLESDLERALVQMLLLIH